MTDSRTDCEGRREQLGRLLDGETTAGGGADLFHHLGGCGECRAYVDTLLLLRLAAGRASAGAAAAADAIAPSRIRPRRAGAGWRLPVPAAVAAALVLLLGGGLLGAAWMSGAAGARGAGGHPAVVVVCSLPEVVVR